MGTEFNMKEVDFWLHYLVDHYTNKDKTWDWAFIVCPNGEIIVRDGPWWNSTGVYTSKRSIRGCRWE